MRSDSETECVAMQIEPRCGHFFAALRLLLLIRGALASLELDTVPPPPSTAEIKRLAKRERERQLRAIKLPQVRSNPTLFFIHSPPANGEIHSHFDLHIVMRFVFRIFNARITTQNI